MSEEFFTNWGVLPTLEQLVGYWVKDVKRMDEWKRIDIDEYLEYLYGRESIQDKLETESLKLDLKTALAEADKFFISITKETEKSVLSIKSCDPLVHKDKYWFGYRLLKSKYEQWLLYAHF